MHVFDYRFLKEQGVDPIVLQTTSGIDQARIESIFLMDEYPSLSEALRKRAMIMSVIDSNAIEGIFTTQDDAIGIISERTAPKGHDQEDIAGYRDALKYIHENHENIDLTKDEILKIFEILIGHKQLREPGFKIRDNAIIERDVNGKTLTIHKTVPAADVEWCIDQLIAAYWEVRDDPDVHSLLLIPCVINDFLKIHPFIDGNGRMSRLLTVLLLYKEGYNVCRFISMESKINDTKIDYYHALELSQKDWMDNRNDYNPFIYYFLTQLYYCYKELQRLAIKDGGRKKKTDAINLFLKVCNMPVSKKDLCILFPELSESSIENVLNKMCQSGEVVKIGSTKAARYVSKDTVRRI